MSRSRSWVWTLNNVPEVQVEQEHIDIVERLKQLECNYIVWGYEIGQKTRRPHLQGYIEFKNAVTGSAFNKKCGLKKGNNLWINCEAKRGTPKQAAGYCKKGEGPNRAGMDPGNELYFETAHESWVGFENGTITQQGVPQSLEEAVTAISQGASYQEVNEANNWLGHQYGRVLREHEMYALRRKWRTWMTQGEWYFGPAEIGKSHVAFDGYSPETHYVWILNEEKQGYNGQDIIIINDFRGQIRYSELLTLVDKWPHTIARKYSEEGVPCLAKKVIITSCFTPKECYNNLSVNDSLAQLYRRFKFFTKTTQKCQKGNNEPSVQMMPWIEVESTRL